MSTIEQANYLEQLESESIYILREVAGQFERPALLLAEEKIASHWRIWLFKAFRPGKIPFTFVHVDTGHISRRH